MTETSSQEGGGRTSDDPLEALKRAGGGFARALGGRAVDKITDRVGGLSDRLTSFASGESQGGGDEDEGRDDGDGGEQGSAKAAAAGKAAEKLASGESPIKAGLSAAGTGIKEKIKGLFGRGKGGKGGGRKMKFNNFVDSFDIGVPVQLAYNQWTTYDQWPNFMKKTETAELDADQGKVKLKGQVFWSHREWETTIKEQVPNKRIVWDSAGPKGHISGAVTFHSLEEDLTRIVVVLEYYPQGFFEKTANIWRAANRRMRLEIKFFIRQVMRDAILHPEDFEGYRAEIHDKEIVRTHEDVMEEERQAEEEAQGEQPEEGEEEQEPEAEGEGEEPEGEEEEPEEEEGPEEEEEPEPAETQGRTR
ncbi:SRPBCC family protein [Georgenia thermotolerans]|uniref:Cyclase n=1 Tax=Georgenia thermotolerans TaxID=527326 RepID=A0A7J5UNI2_9MICO|nr:SRPBCC family protein [Georgenia thermotolerans]KAE8763907.1 cyclase [Georgenia thermotolerans]